MAQAAEQWASRRDGFLQLEVIGKVDLEAQKGEGWGQGREEAWGRKGAEEGVLTCGCIWGAVEMT